MFKSKFKSYIKTIIELKSNLNKFIKIYERIKKIFKDMKLLENISDIEINAIALNPEILDTITISLKNKKRVIAKMHEDKENREFELRKLDIKEMYKELTTLRKILFKNKYIDKVKFRNLTSKLHKLCTIEDTIEPHLNTREYNNTRKISINKKYMPIDECGILYKTK